MRKKMFLAGVLLFVLCLSASISTAQVKVFVLAGESNAVGYGSSAYYLPTNLQKAQVQVLFSFEIGPWDSVTNPAKRISSREWGPLQYQTDHDFGTFGPYVNGFGPEIKAGHTLAKLMWDDVAIIKFAINDTSLAHEWHPTAGVLYPELTAYINNAMADLALMGLTADLGGFFWMQGEWDARNSVDATNYENNLTTFIQQIRTDLGKPNLPFVIGRLNQNIYLSSFGITQTNLNTVRTAQQSVADTLAKTAIVYTDFLTLNPDFLHFKWDGQLGLGHRFAVANMGLDDTLPPLNSTDSSTIDLHPGDTVRHFVTGPPGSPYILFLSIGEGPLNTPWGIAGLDLPVFQIFQLFINSDGFHMVPMTMQDPGVGFYKWYTHALVDANPPVWAFGGNNPNGTHSIVWALTSP
ncbi:MAG: sialate O-acetylesterase [Planctomycetota bacterium]|jgi:hypothetical protein